MSVTLEQIKSLRDATGISITACKKALTESDGDVKKAIEILRKKGESLSSERQGRSTGQGSIASYVHSNNKIGVLVEVGSETDFVAKSDAFKEFAKDLAMQIAATNPMCISPDEVSEETLKKEREIWAEQLKNEKKPENVIEKILEGKEKKFREENALLKQAFVKNTELTIEQLLNELVAKLGENIQIKRFTRFAI